MPPHLKNMIARTSPAWRLLPFSRLPADRQLAWSDAMLTAVTVPALRWHQTVPNALVLGRAQAAATVEPRACRAAGCRVYRRATGGAAVLSGPELLSLDVVLPAGHELAIAGVMNSYRWLADALASGLRGVGVSVELVPPDTARTRNVPIRDPLRLFCYAMLSPYEVVAGGRKLVGLAQARRRAGVLLQAGIVLRWQPERLLPLLALTQERRAATIVELRDRATGLDELDASIEPARVQQTLTDAIAAAARSELRQTTWTEAERSAFAEALPGFAPLY